MRSEKGQGLIILLVVIPLLILIFHYVARSGAIALRHDQIENHCDKKILDALSIEARALEELGKLNPFARKIIKTRRYIEPLTRVLPQLISIKLALEATQKTIGLIQKGIKLKTSEQFSKVFIGPPPKKFAGKIKERYEPFPLVNFYLKDEEGYEGEIGPPLQPVQNFSQKTEARGKINIFTEKFLSWWPSDPKNPALPDMILQCRAQIRINRLEDPWTVQLVKPVAKL